MSRPKSTHCKTCGVSFEKISKCKHRAECIHCGVKYIRIKTYERYTKTLEKRNKTRKRPATHCIDCGVSFEKTPRYRHYAMCNNCGKRYSAGIAREYYRQKLKPKRPQKLKTLCNQIMEACQ